MTIIIFYPLVLLLVLLASVTINLLSNTFQILHCNKLQRVTLY